MTGLPPPLDDDQPAPWAARVDDLAAYGLPRRAELNIVDPPAAAGLDGAARAAAGALLFAAGVIVGRWVLR